MGLDGNTIRKESDIYLPLYESKMCNLFNHRNGDYALAANPEKSHVLPRPDALSLADPQYVLQARFWVPQTQVTAILAGKWDRKWLLGYRNVTDARASIRSAIVSLFPSGAVGNSMPLLLPDTSFASSLLYANLASFCFDYLVRQKLGGVNLNFFIFNQLPVLPPAEYAKPCPWLPSERLRRGCSPASSS